MNKIFTHLMTYLIMGVFCSLAFRPVSVYSLDGPLSEGLVIAGNDSIGSTDYPNGGMFRVKSTPGLIPIEDFRCGVIDTERGYAWLATETIPAHIVKVRLGDENSSVEYLHYITLPHVNSKISCAVIDKENGFAYFGTNTSPGRIVKIDLGEGDNPPVFVGALTLESDETHLASAVIDTDNGYAYFGTRTNPGIVVQVRLGEGYAPPSRVGSTVFEFGEESLTSAVIDNVNGFAYFGTSTRPGRVIKMSLGNDTYPPERVGAVTLELSDSSLQNAFIDIEDHSAYFFSRYGRCAKICLGYGFSAPQHIGSVPLAGYVTSAAFDSANRYAYLGTNSTRFYKIAVNRGNELPELIGYTQLETGLLSHKPTLLDTDKGFAYVGLNRAPGRIMQMTLGEDNALPEFVDSIVFDRQDRRFDRVAYSPDSKYVLFGTEDRPGRAIKSKLGFGTKHTRILDNLDLQDTILSATLTSQNDYAIFGTNTPRVIKVALGQGDQPPYVIYDELLLENPERYLYSSFYNPLDGNIYFGGGAFYAIGRIIKVDPGEGNESPTRIEAIVLNDNELPSSVVFDSVHGYAYFGTRSFPGKIIKVATHPEMPLERIGALVLPDEYRPLNDAFIDQENGYAYFLTNTDPIRIVKIILHEHDLPEYAGSTTLNAYGDSVTSFFNSANGYAYVGVSGNMYATLKKFRLLPGMNPPELIDTITFDPNERDISSSMIYPDEGYAFFAFNGNPGRIVDVSLSHKYFIKGNRIHVPEDGYAVALSFYSHFASGNLRFALYSDDIQPNLIWQSEIIENTAEEQWLTIDMSNTTPYLASGSYWLVWQTDSSADVPSYDAGAQGSGLKVLYDWDSFPDTLNVKGQSDLTFNSDMWSAYVLVAPETPKPTPDFSLNLVLNRTVFRPGEPFLLGVTIENLNRLPYYNQPFFVLLDVYGSYYFYPSWTHELDFMYIDITQWIKTVPILYFDWPEVNDSADGIAFHAAILNSDLTSVIGNIDTVTFGWTTW